MPAAAPGATGPAGRLPSTTWDLTATQIQAIIQFSAEDQVGATSDTLGRDPYYGYGRINADDAVALAAADRALFTGDDGWHMASIDTKGNLVIEGDLTSDTGAPLTPLPTDLLVVRDTSSLAIARITETGGLILSGSLSEFPTSIGSVGSTDPFAFYNDAAPPTPVARIDNSGNLKLKGRAFVGGDPDRSSSQGH